MTSLPPGPRRPPVRGRRGAGRPARGQRLHRAEAKSQTEWAVERAEEALHSLASIERAKGESGWLVKDYGRDAGVLR